eukprot:8666-Heterococcus_DN1.PRE.1
MTCAVAGVEGAKGYAKFLEKQQASEMSRVQALAQRMLGTSVHCVSSMFLCPTVTTLHHLP